MRVAVLVVLLAACEKADAPVPPPPEPPVPSIRGIELPEVTGTGYEPTTAAPRIVVSATAITFDGTRVVALHDGKVDGSDLDGTGGGVVIPALVRAVVHSKGSAPIIVAFDRREWADVMFQVLRSLRTHEVAAPGIVVLARTKTAFVGVPITTPHLADADRGVAFADALSTDTPHADVVARHHGTDLGLEIDKLRSKTPPSPPPPPPPVPLGMIVSIVPGRVTLFSISGVEGSLAHPAKVLARTDDAAFAELSTSLDEIMRRRWGGKRPDADRAIIVTLQRDVPIEVVARALGAAHAQFADVVLASLE